MSDIEINGVRLHYTDTGAGTGAGKETIVFSHGLLMSNQMFAKQIAHLSDRYRCIGYDHRGQAGSGITKDGYDMDTLADDAAGLINALNLGPCHFAGLSMGGFVGMRLAINTPQLLKSLILLDTSAEAEPAESAPKYKMLNFIARWFGLGVVVGQVMPILFGKTFMSDPARADERAHWKNHIAKAHDRKSIVRAVKGVIDRDGVYDRLGKITVPTLVVVGSEDSATPQAIGQRIADAVDGADFRVIDQAGHSSTIEQPDAVNDIIDGFLAGLK